MECTQTKSIKTNRIQLGSLRTWRKLALYMGPWNSSDHSPWKWGFQAEPVFAQLEGLRIEHCRNFSVTNASVLSVAG